MLIQKLHVLLLQKLKKFMKKLNVFTSVCHSICIIRKVAKCKILYAFIGCQAMQLVQTATFFSICHLIVCQLHTITPPYTSYFYIIFTQKQIKNIKKQTSTTTTCTSRSFVCKRTKQQFYIHMQYKSGQKVFINPLFLQCCQ